MDDCRRISRRVVLASAAFALGAAATATVVSRTAAQQKLSQATPNIRLRRRATSAATAAPLPTSERVQSRPRRHQPERLVPAVCQEDVVLSVFQARDVRMAIA